MSILLASVIIFGVLLGLFLSAYTLVYQHIYVKSSFNNIVCNLLKDICIKNNMLLENEKNINRLFRCTIIEREDTLNCIQDGIKGKSDLEKIKVIRYLINNREIFAKRDLLLQLNIKKIRFNNEFSKLKK